jgi:hypothetical protein
MLVASTISLTTFITNQAVYGQTLKKTSMSVLRPLTIQSSDIKAEIDYPATLPQVYTFGTSIQNRWVATGGTPSISYSDNGITWHISINGNSILPTGVGVAWNGLLWIAVGQGNYVIASSTDGDTWVGRNNSIFTIGYNVAWGNNRWVAVGQGTNTIAYSDNGITWFPSANGNAILTVLGLGVAWNGVLWVAVGGGANTIVYSSDGISWSPSANGNAILTTAGLGVAWNGNLWVAVGQGANTIAYSYDGNTWYSTPTPVFSSGGTNVAWNGVMWIAVGLGTNSIAYSYDGINWTGLGFPVFTSGDGIAWNGVMWVATGTGTYSIAYSYNGLNWTGVPSFSGGGQKVAFNNRRPYTLTFPTNVSTATIGSISTSYTFPISIAQGSQLDIVSDAYYNTGYTNFSMVARGQYS